MVEMDAGVGNFEKGKTLPQYIAALAVCMGSVACGNVLGWTGNFDLEKDGFNGISIDSEMVGWIGSMATLGAMVMCFPIGFICDFIGRKYAMLCLIVPFMAGWLIIIFATNIEMIYAGRFITGMAGGAFCVSAPMYTAEIAQKEVRGALGSYFQLLLTVGILVSYLVGAFASPSVTTIVVAVFPLLFGLAFFYQPETPIYLLKNGKDSMARKSLLRLRGNKYDVDTELKEMKVLLEEEKASQTGFVEGMKTRAAKKATFICFGLMFFQQLSGVNAVIFYTSPIFSAAKVSISKENATIIVGVTQVIATFVSSLVIDKLGRKILLIISDIVMAISAILLGLFFSLSDRHLVDQDTLEALGFLPVLSLCVYITVFSLGYGPIPWMITAEIIPPSVKTIITSAACTFNWLMAFFVTKYYVPLEKGIGGDVTFYIFGGISVLGTLFVLFFVPETKGKTLDEIQRELNGEKVITSHGNDNKGFNKE